MRTLYILFTLLVMIPMNACTSSGKKHARDLFEKENLLAWCIVPFDAVHRTPEQRASMLDSLGITQLAYDYRDEHIPFFREEIGVLKDHGIRLAAVWLWVEPRGDTLLNEANRAILKILEEEGVKTELWVSFPAWVFEGMTDQARLNRAVEILEVVHGEAERIGCTLSLYNHGDWFGEPENQVRIIEELSPRRTGIVYNFHHGHHQADRFGELLELMLPYLTAINLDGMKAEGPQIITLGEGDLELGMMRMIATSGYDGPIGIIGHTEGEDIRVVLERNLEGLEKLRKKL
jgi:hypothetical protein